MTKTELRNKMSEFMLDMAFIHRKNIKIEEDAEHACIETAEKFQIHGIEDEDTNKMQIRCEKYIEELKLNEYERNALISKMLLLLLAEKYE